VNAIASERLATKEKKRFPNLDLAVQALAEGVLRGKKVI
jgi:hypothetical protein